MPRLLAASVSILLCCLSCLQAQQAPAGIPYQAIMRDSSTLLANESLTLTFAIRQDTQAVYAEDHLLQSNGYGLVVTVIGQGEPTMGSFDAIDWRRGNVHVKVQVELDTVKDLGEFPLWTAPYAFYSDRSETSQYSDSSATVAPFPLSHLIDVGSAAPDSGQVLTWDGQSWTPAPIQRLHPGPGITFQDSLVVNTGDLDPSDDLIDGDPAGGDLGDQYPNPLVVGIQGRPVQPGQPGLGHVLKWNGGEWAPAADFGGNSPWTQNGGQVSYLGGNVNIGTSQTSARLTLGGGLEGYTSNGALRYGLQIANNAGEVATYGPSGLNLRIGTYGNNPNLPHLELFNAGGSLRGSLGVTSDDLGELMLYGDNGTLNVRGNALLGFPDNGYLAVHDPTGGAQAGMYVNSAGQGIIFGDQKNFRMPHPENPDQEIWYGSLEGPELAAYVRGTAELVDGEAWVAFPEHFRLVANASTMTVTLTPLDRRSEGLAVIEKTEVGFRVAELRDGQGSYAFDWEVKCVRAGREDFQVIRPKRGE